MTWCTTNPSQGTLPRADTSGSARRGHHLLAGLRQCSLSRAQLQAPKPPALSQHEGWCGDASLPPSKLPTTSTAPFPTRRAPRRDVPPDLSICTLAWARWAAPRGSPCSPQPPVPGAAPSAEAPGPVLSCRGFLGSLRRAGSLAGTAGLHGSQVKQGSSDSAGHAAGPVPGRAGAGRAPARPSRGRAAPGAAPSRRSRAGVAQTPVPGRRRQRPRSAEQRAAERRGWGWSGRRRRTKGRRWGWK